MVNAYTLAFAGALRLAGRLVANHGVRMMFLVGIGCCGAASLACGLAPTAWLLVVARAVQAPPLDTITPAAARADALAAIPLTGAKTELASVRDMTIDTATGPVPIRVYRPSVADGLPVSTYFHGGGWVTGDLDTHDTVCRDIAAASGVVIVAVDYWRAPEHPFPAAVDDCGGVTRRLLGRRSGPSRRPRSGRGHGRQCRRQHGGRAGPGVAGVGPPGAGLPGDGRGRYR